MTHTLLDTKPPTHSDDASSEGRQKRLTLHWFLPPFADSRFIVGGGHGSGYYTGDRIVDLKYLKQIAQAAETNGFDSVLIPVGLWCEDPWLVASSLLDATDRLKFLVAVRPGLATALHDAQAAATFQRLSGGRLNVNVVTGGEDQQQRAFGDTLTKDERYERTDEYLRVWKALWEAEKPVSFHGRHVHVEDTLLPQPTPVPPIYFAGSSAAAGRVASRHADTYLTWGEPPAAVEEKLDWIRDGARQHGRSPSNGLRVHVIARDTSEEAWQVAEKLLGQLSPGDVRHAQERLARSQSESQRRISELHGRGSRYTADSNAHDLEIYPGLWAGVGLVRGGAGTALVGSYEEVAELIATYHQVGVDELVLSGYPHLEETFHVGEGVVPALHRRGFTVAHHANPLTSALPSVKENS